MLSENEGFSVSADKEEALQWFSKGGELNDDLSAYSAGMIYYSKGDYENAIKFLKISAEQDNSDAYLRLSEMYLSGIGVAKNEEKAKELFERANRNVYELL